MNKGKVTLIIVAGVLALIAIFLFFNLQSRNKVFNDLKISYKGQNSEYTDLEVDTTILNVSDVSFQVVSKSNNTIVLATADPLLDENGKEIGTEYKVEMQKYTTICFADSDCAYLTLE